MEKTFQHLIVPFVNPLIFSRAVLKDLVGRFIHPLTYLFSHTIKKLPEIRITVAKLVLTKSYLQIHHL